MKYLLILLTSFISLILFPILVFAATIPFATDPPEALPYTFSAVASVSTIFRLMDATGKNLLFNEPLSVYENPINVEIESTGEYTPTGNSHRTPPIQFNNNSGEDWIVQNLRKGQFVCYTSTSIKIINTENGKESVIINNKYDPSKTDIKYVAANFSNVKFLTDVPPAVEDKHLLINFTVPPGKNMISISRSYDCYYATIQGFRGESGGKLEKIFGYNTGFLSNQQDSVSNVVSVSGEGFETTTTTKTPTLIVPEICKVDSDCGENNYCIDLDADGVRECVDSQGNRVEKTALTGSFILTINKIIDFLQRLF